MSARHRRSIRLRGYDYSRPGAYFVTICTQDRTCLFGDVVDDVMRLSDAGAMVGDRWRGLSARFPQVAVDEFVVMPNHLHGILVVGAPLVGAPDASTPVVGAPLVGAPDAGIPDVGAPLVGALDPGTLDMGAHKGRPYRLGDVVGAFKSITTVAYGREFRASGWQPYSGRLWQRNYYEQILRDDESAGRIRQYIRDNPAHWAADRENPGADRDHAEEEILRLLREVTA